MSILIESHVIVASLNALVGCYVFYKNPKSPIHRAFFAIAIGIAGWMFGLIFLVTTGQFFFVALVLWSGELAVIGFVVFSRVFPSGHPHPSSFIVWTPWIALFALVPSRWFIASVAFNTRGYLEPENGPLFPVFAIIMAFYIFLSFYQLLKTFRKSFGVKRVQMRYFLFGVGVFLVAALIFDILLPAFKIFTFNLIGPLGSVVFVGSTAYAIVHHKFLDIHVVIKRSIAYFASIVAVATIFFGLEFLIEKFFYTNDEIVDIGTAIVGAFVLAWLKEIFGRLTDRIFFRADYDYAAAVRDLGPILNSTIELKNLATAIDEFLARTVKPTKTLLIADQDEGPFLFIHEKDRQRDPTIISDCKDITEKILLSEILIVQEEEFIRSSASARAYRTVAERHGFSAIVPFVANDAAVGTLWVGEKLSDDILRPKDVNLLSVLSHQGGMAMLNARFYESIHRHNEELENVVAERTREVKEMYRAQEQFVTDISHQLQTPIAILAGNLELTENNPSERNHHVLRTMRDTLDGMAKLVANFLEIARLNFSKNKFHQDRFDMGELMKEVHEDCLVLGEAKKVRMQCFAESAVVMGDRQKMKEVILNLISNALKHTEPEGIITLECREHEDATEIAIRDTGDGISTENLAHIFERFYRIPGTGTYGTGLGLNICREIVEFHGGTIQVKSIVGKGSTFTIRLPLAARSDSAPSAIL